MVTNDLGKFNRLRVDFLLRLKREFQSPRISVLSAPFQDFLHTLFGFLDRVIALLSSRMVPYINRSVELMGCCSRRGSYVAH